MPEPGHNEVAALAKNLARNCGFAVFPCRGDKSPATPYGFKDATSDANAITALWRRYPGLLIGIATGEASGVDVLDIDAAKHTVALTWWEAASLRMPPTRLYGTRSGGLHAYFIHADGVANTTSKLARGVDTRGSGGYAIGWFAAGYECLDHAPPARWRAWLLECVLWKPAPAPVRRVRTDAGNAVEGVLRVVAAADEGSRNRILFWGACRLRERDVAQGEAEALLIAAARAAGLRDIEARRTIASAWRTA
jgi:hypothetical protein